MKLYRDLVSVDDRRGREMHPEQTATGRPVIHQPDRFRFGKPLFELAEIEETDVPVLVMGSENTSDFSHLVIHWFVTCATFKVLLQKYALILQKTRTSRFFFKKTASAVFLHKSGLPLPSKP